MASTKLEGLVFRTYTPQDPRFNAYCVAKVDTAELEAAVAAEIEKTLEKAEKQVSLHVMLLPNCAQDFYQLVRPSSENADIKRALGKKLDVLEKKTLQALVKLRDAIDNGN